MKTKGEHIILFGPSGCLSRRAIELFIDGKLDEKEEKLIVQHTKNCELCSDAIDGAKNFASAGEYSQRLDKMGELFMEYSNSRSGKIRKMYIGISSIAASILLFFGVYYVIQFRDNMEKASISGDYPTISVVTEDEKPIPVKPNTTMQKDLDESLEKSVTKPENKQLTRLKRPDPTKVETDVYVEEPKIEIEDKPLNLKAVKTQSLGNASKKVTRALAVNSSAENQPMAADEESSMPSFTMPVEKKKSFAEKRAEKAASKKYYVAEVMPMFKGGGIDSFSRYIADSLKIILPDTILNKSILISFRINSSGKIDNVKLINGTTSKELNNRIINIVENSPDWVPAYISGAPVSVDQQMEVVLK